MKKIIPGSKSNKKDPRDLTVRDMEAMESDRRKTGREKARNLSLKYKVALTTLLVTIIPMVILASLMLIFYGRAMTERGNRQIEENIRIMADRIDSVLMNGELCSNELTIEFGSLYNDRNMKQVTRDNKIISQLSQSILIYNGISSIVFIDEEGHFYVTDPSMVSMREGILESEYMEILRDANGKTRLLNVEDNLMNRPEKPVVTMGKHVINITNGSSIGYLFINMDQDYLVESAQSEISYYFLYDTDGYCVSESNNSNPIYNDADLRKSLFQMESGKLRYGGETYLTARSTLPVCRWILVGMTNMDRFNVTGRDLALILLITGGITAGLLFVAVAVYASMITGPLRKLHEGAEQIADGDLNFRFHFKNKDEIGRLARIFNYMTERNRELLIRVDEEAKKKREYELALIQEQVKPHFLYNTLDIVIMLIEMNRSREAARVTQKLAAYYKNTLSGSEEIVHVEREIEIIRDYLDLQTMRYGDKFSYEIDVPEETYQALIPKMTLQPLIENALYHGLKNQETWGSIRIEGSIETGEIIESDLEKTGELPQKVVIRVIDDGVGIPKDKLDALNRELTGDKETGDPAERDSGKGSHFGLYSVAHRIRLYFGDDYGIRLEPGKEKGTEVVIRIPLRTSEKH
ncbi:MAG: histidine kinase [Lachnospiraceae bacterium]|nr:histidine kinase [Lachnospiraceae bacterium]